MSSQLVAFEALGLCLLGDTAEQKTTTNIDQYQSTRSLGLEAAR